MINENKLYVANNAGGIYRIQKLACQHSSQKSKGLEVRNQLSGYLIIILNFYDILALFRGIIPILVKKEENWKSIFLYPKYVYPLNFWAPKSE